MAEVVKDVAFFCDSATTLIAFRSFSWSVLCCDEDSSHFLDSLWSENFKGLMMIIRVYIL